MDDWQVNDAHVLSGNKLIVVGIKGAYGPFNLNNDLDKERMQDNFFPDSQVSKI